MTALFRQGYDSNLGKLEASTVNWVTALFRQGYDCWEGINLFGDAIEWLPYLGRVTTSEIALTASKADWVTALFRQGYDN